MAAYAQAWAGESPLAADAVTASPYLGFGSLRPLLDIAAGTRARRLRAGGHLEPGGRERAARRRGGPADGRTVAQCDRRRGRHGEPANQGAPRNGPGFDRCGGRGDAARSCPTSVPWAARCWRPASGPRVDGPSDLGRSGRPGACPRCRRESPAAPDARRSPLPRAAAGTELREPRSPTWPRGACLPRLSTRGRVGMRTRPIRACADGPLAPRAGGRSDSGCAVARRWRPASDAAPRPLGRCRGSPRYPRDEVTPSVIRGVCVGLLCVPLTVG